MASAQVLSNSTSSLRKQGHLEAGKRRLEEFRKKKAEGRAKKPASTGQQQFTDVSQYAKQTQESESKRLLDLDGAATAERGGVSGMEPLLVLTSNDSKPIDSSETVELGSYSGTHTGSLRSDGSYNAFYADEVPVNDPESKQYHGSELPGTLHLHYDGQEEKNRYPSNYNGIQGTQTNGIDQSSPHNFLNGLGYNDGNIYQSSHSSISEAHLKGDESYLKEDSGTSHASVTSISSEKPTSFRVQREAGFTSTSASTNASSALNGDSISSTTTLIESVPEVEQYAHASMDFNDSMFFDAGRRKLSSSHNHEPSIESTHWQSSDPHTTGFSFDFKSPSNHVPVNSVISEIGTRRSRPSFLDSLNVPRVSSMSHFPFTQSEKTEPYISKSSKVNSADMLASAISKQPFIENVTIESFDKLKTPNPLDMYDRGNNSVVMSNEDKMLSQGVKDQTMEWKHEFRTVKEDENFAALEQHIEDLTQEKFSIQRALDASRALAESLATENSSLTDSYNQQGTVVNQLKSDMERLQDEIKVQLMELESFKLEYANAQLECNAADERAKILASEVIGLEEKALKLRSRELKLERQLENSNAEISSYKRKVSSLEKERQDLQFTIDALQEEKKLLQSKLRKASGSVKSMEVIKTPLVLKDVSTSTEDLGFEVSNLVGGENSDVDTTQNALSHLENRQLHLPVASASIPLDQLRTIGNINSLIAELALEKEDLMRALNSESSQSSKLKELNEELSRKLEAQTQRLELLTAQSMANENILTRPTESRPTHDGVVYTDEGDEVVERVLGWIMKLFPGGPSKRRTSKLL